MKKIIKQFVIITAVMLVSINFANAQITFQKKYGGVSSETGFSVQQTFDGGYIVLGETASFGGGVYLIKTDAFGDTVWTKIYHAASMGTDYSVEQTVDSGFIIAATISGISSGSHILLIRTNSIGDTLWTKVYQYVGTGGPRAVRQTADGGFIIVQDYGGVLLKISASGNIQWSKTYSSGLSDIQIIGSGYAVAGLVGTNLDMCLLMSDSAGNVLWSKTYGRLYPFRDFCTSLKSTSDGGFILAGFTYNYANQWPDYDIYVVKTDSVGDTLWTRFYGYAGSNEFAIAIVQTADNGFVIVGSIYSSNPFLLKIDSNGDTLWTTGFNYPMGPDNCNDIARTSDDGFIVTGTIAQNGVTDANLYLLKTDSLGYLDCYGSNIAFTRFFYTTLVTNTIVTASSVVITETYPAITMTSGGTVASICTSTGIPQQNDIISKPLVYPNPGNGIFNLQLNNKNNEQVSISVIDITGRIIFAKDFGKHGEQFNESIDLGNFIDGIYLMQASVGEHIFSKKVIVQHN